MEEKVDIYWTGERYLPWMEAGEIHYEHIHRYAFAYQFVKNKRVIDLACGEGYGSNMLAESARYVLGIDIDEQTIKHAKRKYKRENLDFIRGDITSLPINEKDKFDVIICFEAIEHIIAQREVLREIKRLLKPEGLLIISTPNKDFFENSGFPKREFHLKELSFKEFNDLLSEYFEEIIFLGQRLYLSSIIWYLKGKDDHVYKEFIISNRDGEFSLDPTASKVPAFYIAIASNNPVAFDELQGSFLLESKNILFEKKNKLIADISQKDSYISSLQNAIKEKDDTLNSLYHDISQKDSYISSLQNAIKEKRETLNKVYHIIGEKERVIQNLNELLIEEKNKSSNLRTELSTIKNSKIFKLISRLGLL